VDGQPTVDENPSCEATTLDEVKTQTSMLYGTVNRIQEELAEVKNLLVSLQQSVDSSNSS